MKIPLHTPFDMLHLAWYRNKSIFRIGSDKLYGFNTVVDTFAFLDDGSSDYLIDEYIEDQL